MVVLAPVSASSVQFQRSSEQGRHSLAFTHVVTAKPHTEGSRNLPRLLILGTDCLVLKPPCDFLLKEGCLQMAASKVLFKTGRGFTYHAMRTALTWVPITYFSIIKKKKKQQKTLQQPLQSNYFNMADMKRGKRPKHVPSEKLYPQSSTPT